MKILKGILGVLLITIMIVLVTSTTQGIVGERSFKTEFVDTVKEWAKFMLVLIMAMSTLVLCAYIFNKTISKL